MQLPPRPSLEQFRKQAKDLHKAHRLADPCTVERIRTHLPRLSQTPSENIPVAAVTLQEVQHVVARDYGFKNWRALQIVAEVEFDLLAQLDDADAQVLLRKVSTEDCIAALKDCADATRQRLLGNVSPRVRGFLESEEVRGTDLSDADVRDAQRRILLQAKLCAEAGHLRWPEGAEVRTDAVPARHDRPLDDLARCPLDQISANDLASMWAGCARLAHEQGREALEAFDAEHETTSLVGEALRLASWGTEPDLIEDLLLTRSQMTLIPRQTTRCRMVIEGLMSISAGDYPRVVRYKLGTFYHTESPADDADESDLDVGVLLDRLRSTPLATMPIEALAAFLVDMSRVAGTGHQRRNDFRLLRPLIDALSGATDIVTELLRRGLKLLLDESAVGHLPKPIDRETGPDVEPRREAFDRVYRRVLHTLEKQLTVRLAGLEQAHRMLVTGVVELVRGADPEQVRRAVRQVAA